MSFDDLAKNLAERDGKQASLSDSSDPNQIIASAQRADAQSTRTRNLVLGPLMLVGGGLLVVLGIILMNSSDGSSYGPAYYMLAFGGAGLVAGAAKTFMGVRNISVDGTAESRLDAIKRRNTPRR